MANVINSVSSNQVVKQENFQNTLAKSKQVVSDNFESNSAVKTLSGAGEQGSFKESIKYVPFLYVLDKFADSRMGGNIEKSSLGKAANLGDKISDFFKLDRFLSEEKISKIKNFFKTNRFTKYFTNDFKATPKSSFAKSQTLATRYSTELDGLAQKLLGDFTDIKYSSEAMEKLKTVATPETLSFINNVGPLRQRLSGDYLNSIVSTLTELGKSAGTNVDEKQVIDILQDAITQFKTGTSGISEQALSEQIATVLTSLGKGKHKLSKEALDTIATAGTKTFTKEQILSAFDDLAKNGIELTGSKKLGTVRNKLQAAESKVGKTVLGKSFSKGLLKTKDIVTYGGGLISIFFMASALYNAIKATKEAPKGEKKATFMHVLSEQYLGMILFQPSINLLYKLGGNKYRGMTTEGKKALKDLITKTNLDDKLTKEGLKIAKLQRDLLIKGVSKDKVATLAGKSLTEAKTLAQSLGKEGAKLKFWEKPLKFMGRILSTGLDKMQIPKFLKSGKKMPQPTLKGFAGGLGRFALIMFVIQPLIQKPITKLFHKIFGKPKTYLEKQAAASKQQTTNNIEQPTQNNTEQETNLIKKWSTTPSAQVPEIQVPNAKIPNNQIPNQPASGAQGLNTQNPPINNPSSQNGAVPALNIFNKDKQAERYIPSINPVAVEDNSAEIQAQVDAILKSTDKVIQNTKKSLY